MRDYVHTVLVCGGRHYGDSAWVRCCLDILLVIHGDLMIITGSCPTGADAYAEIWAKDRQQLYAGFPAQWDKYGKRAGFKRNAEMAALSGANEVVVFQGNRGTLNMLSLARDAERRGELSVWLPDGEFWR